MRKAVLAAGSAIASGAKSVQSSIVAARQKALDRRLSAAQSISQGSDEAADFYDRQPLVIGTLALAVGDALGGALPRTKVDVDLMGSQSDRLYDAAERIFKDEKAKALHVVNLVKDEGRDIATETKSDLDSGAPGGKSGAQAVGDKAKAFAGRVADTAKTAAEEETLGQPKT